MDMKTFVSGPWNMVLLLPLSAKNNPLTQKRIENEGLLTSSISGFEGWLTSSVNPERLNSATNPAVMYRAFCNRAKSAMPDGL